MPSLRRIRCICVFSLHKPINICTCVPFCVVCAVCSDVCWEEDPSLSGRVQQSYLSPLKHDGSLL